MRASARASGHQSGDLDPLILDGLDPEKDPATDSTPK